MLQLANAPRSRLQRGISLIESLVAIVVMALGILGILGVQMRTLADTQTGVRRAQAIRLITDLSERTQVNPNAIGNIGQYVIGWGAPSSPPNCKTAACNAQTLAQYDILQWKQTVADALPLGDANVFTVADETIANNRRQLGVMISWRENERVAKVSDDDDADITSYRGAINAGTDGGGVVCPADRSCHLQYIQLNMRCTPYTAGGPSNPLVFCPS